MAGLSLTAATFWQKVAAVSDSCYYLTKSVGCESQQKVAAVSDSCYYLTKSVGCESQPSLLQKSSGCASQLPLYVHFAAPLPSLVAA